MKLRQFLAFLALAFVAVCVYFVLEAVLGTALGAVFHGRLLGTVFDRIIPIAIGLAIAGYLGAWRSSTHVAFMALAVFVSALILLPARITVAYLGILLCGALGGGCFN